MKPSNKQKIHVIDREDLVAIRYPEPQQTLLFKIVRVDTFDSKKDNEFILVAYGDTQSIERQIYDE